MSFGKEAQKVRSGLSQLVRLFVLGLFSASAGILCAKLLSGIPGSLNGDGNPAAETQRLGKLVTLPQHEQAPDLAFTAGDGKAHRLSEWRGKVVLVNLWATWCAPCKEELPSLDRLQAKLGGDTFAVLAVSTDKGGPAQPKTFLAQEGLTHLAVYNDSSMGAITALKAEGLPTSVILDKQGVEIARLIGPAQWDSPHLAATIKAFMDSKSVSQE
ncbi:MAG: TlpA disulfide reductase family protein [Rhodomicrobium sp.]